MFVGSLFSFLQGRQPVKSGLAAGAPERCRWGKRTLRRERVPGFRRDDQLRDGIAARGLCHAEMLAGPRKSIASPNPEMR
jgi:hypothetical protein